MSNQKISNLRSLNAETVSQEDLIPVVDVSSPTAVGGELKKISVNQLIGHIADLSLVQVQDSLDDFYLKTGGTISGDVVVNGGISVSGQGSYQGQLTVPLNPTTSGSATSKQYVDSRIASSLDLNGIITALGPTLNTKYDKTGGTISGNAFVNGTLTVSGSSTFITNINVPTNPVSATHATSKQYVDSLVSGVSGLLQVIYPVGALYISTLATNPSILFGFGTWSAFATGSVLVGINPLDSDFNTVEKTGGSKTVTLTPSNLPPHSHSISPPTGQTSVGGEHTHSLIATVNGLPEQFYLINDNNGSVSTSDPTGVIRAQGPTQDNDAHFLPNLPSSGSHAHTVTIPPFDSGLTGGGQPHNNLQPYVVVYMWKRVA